MRSTESSPNGYDEDDVNDDDVSFDDNSDENYHKKYTLFSDYYLGRLCKIFFQRHLSLWTVVFRFAKTSWNTFIRSSARPVRKI